ncbi:PKD domain-containing protein [Nocardioides sp. Iso805N]|uniref:PKD domain-containing protein n=1 Tax=Nocardioides sp. Iso805N TaxID=1283287 RepID=UPI000377B773|nr:hypothetical protein [Nocardioides sp. Iso805N]
MDISRATEVCTFSGHDAANAVQDAGGGTRPNYTFTPNCHSGAKTCAETPTCPAEDGTQGEDMIVYEGTTKVGETCWTGKAPDPPQLPTPDQVMAAARSLSWPAATLIIQPPDGETLVNFATNFYTSTTAVQSHTVPLLSVEVTIEATPAAYVWRFGDGTSHTGSDPGAAYPALGVTHRYLRKGEVAPQVDITYRGRYRFGTGAWRPLPDTLTIPGTPQRLRVLTATPHLVGN